METVMLTSLDVRGWADEATGKFLEHEVPLATSIAKIAQRETLTRDGIQRVIEETNHLVRERLSQQPDYDGHAAYKVAAMKDVQEELKPSESDRAKVAAVDLGVTPTASVPAPLAGLEKTARETEEQLNFEVVYRDAMERLDRAILKVAHIVENGQFVEERRSRELASAVNKLASNAADRLRAGGTIAEMFEYAKLAFPDEGEFWDVTFDGVQELLEKKAHPTPAGWVKEELEMPEHAGKVVVHNGKAALYELLDHVRCNASRISYHNMVEMGGSMLKLQKALYETFENANNDVREWVNRIMPDVKRITGYIEKSAEDKLTADSVKIAGAVSKALKVPATAAAAATKKLVPHMLWMVPSVIALHHIGRGVGDLVAGSEFDPEKERQTTRTAPGAPA